MNTGAIIPRALGLLLFLSIPACEKKETTRSAPSPPSPTDTDLGHGYVRRDGAIHFIGGDKAPSVPDWQLRVFKDMHLVQRMIQAGNLIK
jgi:hypothetical protein